MGAPKGNWNSAKGRAWTDSIKRGIARLGAQLKENDKTIKDPALLSGMNYLAEQLVQLAATGDKWALEQLGDRIEGKPTQMVQLDAEIATHSQESVSESLRWVEEAIGTGATVENQKPRPH